jgi:ADP-heptose:LPS heptosyltransferase
LTSEWLAEVFDVDPAEPYVAPQPQEKIANITVSLGVGDNLTKRIDDEFEYEVLAALLKQGRPILIDRGAGGTEAARVDALVERLGSHKLLQVHDGSYASFASHIAQSDLYVGYDSAGQHVAAAAHVPLVSIFTGYVCDRMLARWRPSGPKAHVIVVNDENRSTALDRTLQAIAEAAEEA